MTDETAIRKAVDDFIAAYNANDRASMQNTASNDVIDMSAGTMTRTGDAAIQFFRSRV